MAEKLGDVVNRLRDRALTLTLRKTPAKGGDIKHPERLALSDAFKSGIKR